MRALVLVAVAVAVAACSQAPAPVVLASSPPAHDDACITPSDAQADSIAVTADAADFCYGAGARRSCWHLDVATRALSSRDVVPPKPVATRAKASVRPDGSLALCAAAGAPCKSVANPIAGSQPDWIAVSDDLSTLALPEGSTLHVFDAATGRRRATIQGWADSPMAGDQFNDPPTFAAADRMIVWYPWTPVSDQGRIFDLSGKQLAIIGHEFWSLGPGENTWHLAGSEWAIKGEANTIATVDARDFKTTIYDIEPLLAKPRPPADSAVGILQVLAIAGSGKRLVIVTGESPVTIGVLDRATKQLIELEPPRCRG